MFYKSYGIYFFKNYSLKIDEWLITSLFDCRELRQALQWLQALCDPVLSLLPRQTASMVALLQQGQLLRPLPRTDRVVLVMGAITRSAPHQPSRVAAALSALGPLLSALGLPIQRDPPVVENGCHLYPTHPFIWTPCHVPHPSESEQVPQGIDQVSSCFHYTFADHVSIKF